jgi:hypothetical protein
MAFSRRRRLAFSQSCEEESVSGTDDAGGPVLPSRLGHVVLPAHKSTVEGKAMDALRWIGHIEGRS